MRSHAEKPTSVLPLLAITLAWLSVPVLAADTIPSRITDPTFWKLVNDISEPGGTFESENWISNETGIQTVIPRLKQLTKPDGVYLGVGPEQNFTYIAAIRPKIAFIIDIRRQNMLQHMVYVYPFLEWGRPSPVWRHAVYLTLANTRNVDSRTEWSRTDSSRRILSFEVTPCSL